MSEGNALHANQNSEQIKKIVTYLRITMIATIILAVIAVGALTYATVKYFQVRASVNKSMEEWEDTFEGQPEDLQDGASKAPKQELNKEIAGYNKTDPQRYRLDSLYTGDCFQATINHEFTNYYYLDDGYLPYEIDPDALIDMCPGSGKYVESDKGKVWVLLEAVMKPDTNGYAEIIDQVKSY